MRRIRGASVGIALALSVWGLTGCGGISDHDAKAYTCYQYEHVSGDQTDAEHSDTNDKIVKKLLGAHGYPATYANVATLKAEIDAKTGADDIAGVDDCTRDTKLDDYIDWTDVSDLKN